MRFESRSRNPLFRRLVLVLLATLALGASALADDAKVSPFTAIRWVGWEPHVEFEGAWYRLDSIDGAPAYRVVEFCRATYGDRARKRFGEDLVQVMREFGRPIDGAVGLDLHDGRADEARFVEAAPMTRANRERIRQRPIEIILTGDQARADLEQLVAAIDDFHSYRLLRPERAAQAVESARRDLEDVDEIALDRFALLVQEMVAAHGDGHAGVLGLEEHVAPGRAPILVGDDGRRLVAFLGDRSALLDPERPYLVAIDGVPVRRWLAAAEALVPAGSTALVRERSIRMLRFVGELRRRLGLPASPTVTYRLTDDARRTVADVEVDLAERRAIYGAWPATTTGTLDGDIGYLRIPSMSGSSTIVEDQMRDLRDTRGLVIDVRGNGGGRRAILADLLPWLLPRDEPIAVVNVAAHRATDLDHERLLAARSLFPADGPAFDDVARRAIERVEAGFVPLLMGEPIGPPDFSAWHYMVVERAGDAPRYDGPVVVLMDGGCFSATDVFLGAMANVPGVVLMGAPSSGGSGCSVPVVLPESGLGVRLSTMASFRPDGRPYDGLGVRPDVEAWPDAGYFVGASDPVLDAAIENLRRRIVNEE